MEEMTIAEAAQFLGISTKTLRRRVEAGGITPLPKPPAAKKVHRLLFRREDIERLSAPVPEQDEEKSVKP